MRVSTKWFLATAAAFIGAVVLYGLVVIQRGFSARAQPSVLETLVAESARSWSIPIVAKRRVNPIRPSEEVYRDARAHFADHCAQCHANNGSGDTPMGRNLYPKPPDLRLPGTQNRTDGELYYTIQCGVRLSGMPAFGDPIDNDQDTWKLVVFIRHIPKISDQEELEMERLNPRSPEEIREEMEEDQFLQTGKSGTPLNSSTTHKKETH